MSELGIPVGLDACTKPKRSCAHDRLTFGCKQCIAFETQSRVWNYLKSNKPPRCGECGHDMIMYESIKNADGTMRLLFGCPQVDGNGDPICDFDCEQPHEVTI